MRSIRQNIRTAVLKYGPNEVRSVQKVSHHEVVGKVSEKCRKTDEVSLEAQFCENRTKIITTKNLTSFWKIFGDFSVIDWQTNSKSLMNEHSHSHPIPLASLSFKTH